MNAADIAAAAAPPTDLPDLVSRFTVAIQSGAAAALADLVTDDVFFDALVPNWRYQATGQTDVVEQLTAWFHLPGRFHDIQVDETSSGDLLVRFEWHEADDTPDRIVVRDMCLWRIRGGRIAEYVVHCAGRWNADLVAQMATEAPLIRQRSAEPPGTAATRAAVERFGAAFERHDIDAIMAAMTDDCIFEDTTPPDGIRHEGAAAVRRAWETLFAGSPDAVFDTEGVTVAGHQAVVQWRYHWTHDGGGHIRGVDLITVRDGAIAEKRSYVKG